MDRKTLVIVVICLLAFMLYWPLLDRLGLGRYHETPRPATTSGAPGAGKTGPETAPAPGGAPTGAPTGSVSGSATAPGPLPTGAATRAGASAAATTRPAPVGRTIVVETPLYRAEFSNLGAVLTNVELKHYASAHPGARHARPGGEVAPADRVRLAGEPTFELGLGSGLAARPLRDIAYAVAESLDAAGAVRTLTFSGQAGPGTEVRQTYRVHPDSYAIDLAVEIRNPPATDTDYTLTLRSWPAETEADRVSDQRALRASSLVGTNIHREHAAGLLRQPKIFEGNVVWAGVQSRYFLVAAAIVEGASRAVVSNAEERAPLAGEPPGPGPGGAYVLAVNRVAMTLPSASRPVHRFVLFAGPSEYAQLARLSGTQLERAVDLGWNWVRPISSLLLRVLNAIHSVVRNYGFAIILLATLLRALLHPLNMAGMKSMRAMQKIQPEMDRIRAKYKDDPQAMNAAVMALYRENKVNPAGGCLPMLLQMPVLISLYQVLFNAIELRQAPFLSWMSDLSAPDLLFGVAGFPIRLLPVLMAGSGFLLQRLTPTTPQQAPTAYMMNLMMLVFFYNMPSGLVLYWTVMNLLSALQQWLVLRHE